MRLVTRSLLREVRRSLLAFVPMLGFLSGPASADLIAVDLDSAGDGLVTRDTATGLEWLDLTLTTNLSVNAILGGAGGWLASGWRYPAPYDLFHLWTNGGIVEISLFGSPANLAGIALLTGLLGETSTVGDIGTFGLALEGCAGPCAGLNFLASLSGGQVGVASMSDAAFDLDYSNPVYGHWLVRDAIPEPATALLLTAGLAWLAARPRQRSSRSALRLPLRLGRHRPPGSPAALERASSRG